MSVARVADAPSERRRVQCRRAQLAYWERQRDIERTENAIAYALEVLAEREQINEF